DRANHLLFSGTIDDLLEQTHRSLWALSAHITRGASPSRLGHPWLSLPMSYLFGVMVESARRSDLRVFLHAGGLTSPYYMREDGFIRRFSTAHRHLASFGMLPQTLSFVVVPIGCCQLFSTESPAALEDLIERWQATLGSLPDRRTVLDALAR